MHQKSDVETNLYYLKARLYSAEWGRFISPDSVEYLDPESINGLNLYCYCENDPVNKYDPSGHFAISALIIGMVVGAGIGFGTAAYIDYKDDQQLFDGSVAWYDYLGATLLGGAIGAGLGVFSGMSFSASIPTFGFINSGEALAIGITGSVTVSLTGAQVLGAAGVIGATYVFYKEHTKNARGSTKGKHQKGQTRKGKDMFRGEKGDDRRPYRRNKKKRGFILPFLLFDYDYYE